MFRELCFQDKVFVMVLPAPQTSQMSVGPRGRPGREREGGPQPLQPRSCNLPRLPPLRLLSCTRSRALLDSPTTELPPRHLASRAATSDPQNGSGDAAFESGLTAGGAPKGELWGDSCPAWEQVQVRCSTLPSSGSRCSVLLGVGGRQIGFKGQVLENRPANSQCSES